MKGFEEQCAQLNKTKQQGAVTVKDPESDSSFAIALPSNRPSTESGIECKTLSYV